LAGRNELGFCSGTHKVRLSNGHSCFPDISYWGASHCRWDTKTKTPRLINVSALPDVVIQFSWQNSFEYKKQAIEDMLSKGLECEGGPLSKDRPRLGYLIKVRFSDKLKMAGLGAPDLVGLDVYRLPHGTTVKQALDPNDSSAEYMCYECGGPDVLVSIRAKDLGTMEGSGADYTMCASDIFAKMREYHMQCQMRGQAM
jgi:hypothetical protein